MGRGAQLVLGLAPDDRGLIPEVDAARLKEFGDEVNRLYGKSVADPPLFRQEALDGDPSTFWSAKEGEHSATITIAQDSRIKFDRAAIMEWLPAGQRVQKYSIWAEDGDTMVKLAEGRTIGHKKIDVFPRTTSNRIELRIEWASEPPHIREFQLFDGRRR